MSLGRAHWPRAAVAAPGPEGLIRKSRPLDTGCHSNHSNQHKRERGVTGLVAEGGSLVDGNDGGKRKSV